ncbi:hypothetical protein ACO22_06720 [Paracoccidioides brasiliensis]|uniref:P/Homo B domain-containing protein n=2 Tax=Paracoccidioides brasiliensis TaxID=121759 RepID=A0A1D2J6M1_PARBR|nr:hypothetical protein ACO22_06720 [Paracoccidioides brasiliensis]
MKLLRVAVAVALVLVNPARASIYPRNHDAYDYFAVRLDSSVSPVQVAQMLGVHYAGQVGELADHHTFAISKELGVDVDRRLEDLRQRRRRRRSLPNVEELAMRDALDGILWSQKLTLRPPMSKRAPPPPPSPRGAEVRHSKPQDDQHSDYNATEKLTEIVSKLEIDDPIFTQQWHLFNIEQPGHDINVTGLWLEGITGKGAISAIVDDGLDMYSNDLKDNYFAAGSYDYNDKVDEPRPRLYDDKHGTRCAGEVAGVRNDVCGVGVAYDSSVAGIRILSKPVSDEDEAASINYRFQDNMIYSCSWGPVDDGTTMDAPGILVQRAIVNGIQKGRGGRGSVYVFAAGNGALHEDNCNFDGYTNSIYSVTVGAIDHNDDHPYYSEPCSAQLVVTYSSGGRDAIHTTDVGLNSCTTKHGGTSAAGPLVVGVVALALSVRPELTWRDVQYILLETAIPINLNESDWQDTATGKKFSHEYGYGKVDAYSAVHLAMTWKLVKPQAWLHSPWLQVYADIPQGDKGLASSFEVTKELLMRNNVERLEHVTLTMNINHTRRGDLSVELRSPTGTVSYLSTTRKLDDLRAGYVDWTFMSLVHWGESGVGKWTVIVKDTVVNDFKGVFIDWQLNLWGEAINADIQGLHPLPDEHDHDHSTQLAPVATTTIISSATASKPTASVVPTDHIDRPVNTKPTGTQSPSQPSETATSSPSSQPIPTSTSESFLPSFFPTFGVSRRTQVWIYGFLTLILIFCSTLGTYFLIQRRKRIRNNLHDDYEFEMIDDESDETHPLSAGEHVAGARTGRKQRRKGGELYDAFAGESDEELLSDGESESGLGEEPYRDEDERQDDGGGGGGGGGGRGSERT